MTKKEISNDVFDSLPIEVRESKLTINQKKILNVLFNYSTLDKSIEHGLFFISNEQLLKEAELEYPTQLQRVLSFLITNKFIERIAGTRSLKNNTSSASTYTINTKKLIEYCEQHPQKTTKKGNVSMGNVSMGNVSKGNVSKGNGVKNVTDVTVINELRKEIELLKVRINNLEMGFSNGNSNRISNVTTDTDIDIENNKLVNIGKYTTGGPIEIIPVIEDNNNELTNIIEYRNNEDMNRENEMNEERMNVMNEAVENENNITPTLEDVLRQQAEEQNDLLREAYNDNFNFEEYNYEEIAKGSKRYNPDKQEQFSRVFTNSDKFIKKWKTTHNPITKAQIESYISVVNLMYKFGEISKKQNEAFTNQITNNFNKLLKGHSEYLKNKKYSSTIFSNKNPQPPRPEENENKAVLSHENSSDIQIIDQSKETQQNANKRAKMAIVERECKAQNKQFNFDTMEMIVNYINSYVESKEEKEEWINRYFDGINHQIPSYVEAMKKKALSKI